MLLKYYCTHCRLSRKQLPTVDLNGNVCYSTPAGKTEIDWLSKATNGSPEIRSQDDSHRIGKPESNSAPPTFEKTNYWLQKKANAEQASRNLDIDRSSSNEKVSITAYVVIVFIN